MEYSFLSQEKFNQIVENHLQNLTKSRNNIVTEETAKQIYAKMHSGC